LIQPFRDKGDKRHVRPVPISIVEVVKHHPLLVKEVVVVATGDEDYHHEMMMLQPQYAD
jgi:hypothetical protein